MRQKRRCPIKFTKSEKNITSDDYEGAIIKLFIVYFLIADKDQMEEKEFKFNVKNCESQR